MEDPCDLSFCARRCGPRSAATAARWRRVRTDDLAAFADQRALVQRLPRVDWAAVDDVMLGCANQAGEDNRNVARMAVLLAGLPPEVPGVTVNRLCASGLEAIGQAARAIRCGEADLVVAGGVESMSRAPLVVGKADAAFSRDQHLEDTTVGWRFVNPVMQARYGMDTNPQTAENLARERGISRADQDAYALRSQQRAEAARQRGWLARGDRACDRGRRRGARGQSGVGETSTRGPATTLEQLSGLKPLLGPGTTITAGNASGINDGACALLLASEPAVGALRPRADRRGSPHGRGAGVRSARDGHRAGAGDRAAARLAGIRRSPTTDVIEINEAFAAQVLACTRELGLPDDAEHVNPNGGAIAFGHPLGASGARLCMTAAFELRRRGGRRAIVSLCVGVGQGLALSLERG